MTDQTAEAFTPPAAQGLPAGTLEAAEIGANRLDAWARTPRGRNFLAHALVQLARTGWLRQEPGDGFEPMTDRPTAEPAAVAVQAPAADPATPSRRAGLRDEIANALEAADYRMDMRRGDLADAVLPVLYREWPWLRAEAEDAASAERAADRTTLRDRIRRAVCGAEGFDWDSDMLEPDEYGEVADAVLAVLPAPTDQAAELERLRTENARMRHELEVMYGGAFDSLKATPTDRTDEPGESR